MNQQDNTEKEQLLVSIEQAFRDVRLEDGISISIAEYRDAGGSEPRFLELAKSDEREDWRRLGDLLLDEHDVTLSFTNPKGLRFYLPAYMGYAIRSNDWPEGCAPSGSAGSAIYAADPEHYAYKEVPIEECFTAEQLSAIMKFLEYCTKQNRYLDGDVAERNLRKIKERKKVSE